MADERRAFAEPSENWSNGTITPEEYELMLADLLKYNLLQETKDGYYQYTNTFFQDIEEIVASKRSINSAGEAIIMRYCQAGVNTPTTLAEVTYAKLRTHTLSKQYNETTQKTVCSQAADISNLIILEIAKLTPRICRQQKESSTSIAILDNTDEDKDKKNEMLLKLMS